MNKVFDFINKELKGWKSGEFAGLIVILTIILYNSAILHDSPVAVTSAVCGILYTIIAGKGKISCYIFGLTGSSFYGYLAFSNALWGNLLLYIGYYIPMQILGIFKWKKNLNKSTNEIYKTTLSDKERLITFSVSLILCIAGYTVLTLCKDSHPLLDSVSTMLSVTGMYLTVKRCIEQWIVWSVVNLTGIIMWFRVIQSGEKVYSTLLMWGVYLVLGIYFYTQWEKELNVNTQKKYSPYDTKTL